jgi:anti-sigma factor RsiW
MTNCQDHQAQLHAYLDGEMAARERVALEAHLLECKECERAFAAAREVVDVVRGAGPLYEAPEGGVDRLREALRRAPGAESNRGSRWRWAAAAAAALVAILPFSFQKQVEAGGFATFAADSHLRYVQGLSPLDVRSSDASEVSRWMSARLPFHLELPEYPQDGGGPKPYHLEGARVMQFDNVDIAYLAYQMDNRPISLLIASAAGAQPSGDQIHRSGNLDFHFKSDRGLQLITWRDKGLVYALASDIQSAGAQSCIICHGSAEERRKFESLTAPQR